MSNWSFYRKTPTGLQIKYTADTSREAERCRQSMIEEYGEICTEVHFRGKAIPTDEPIAPSEWKRTGP